MTAISEKTAGPDDLLIDVQNLRVSFRTEAVTSGCRPKYL